MPCNGEDDHDHDPLYFDPRRRTQQKNPDEWTLIKRREFLKQYDSHAHERRLREQGVLDRGVAPKLYELPRNHPSLLPKPPAAAARLVQPATAVVRAPTQKGAAAPSSGDLPSSASRQLKPSQELPIAARPSMSWSRHKGRQEPVPTPSARQAGAKGAKVQRQPLLDSDMTLSDISLPKKKRKKKQDRKRKRKRRRRDNVIIVSTPSGPFSPGTREVLKNRKALKKAQE
ncbi:hypothetical protein V5799_000633 [Amblyomma americanum]|uniref:Uncharacterized protein n=1 Tax=Amblyomma americanum TaxID=6943 RepID=A0AAQ4D2G2_AMBAM